MSIESRIDWKASSTFGSLSLSHGGGESGFDTDTESEETADEVDDTADRYRLVVPILDSAAGEHGQNTKTN